jgi:hypothetical protein
MAKKPYADVQRELLDSARKAMRDEGLKYNQLTAKQKDAIKREYGYAYQFIASDPTNELKRLFNKAIKVGMTPEAFALELKNTKWYTDRTASQREYETMLNTPSMQKDLNNTLSQIADQIKRQAAFANGTQLSDEEAMADAKELAKNNLRDWSNILPNFVNSKYVSDDVLKFGGQAAADATEIRNFARSMGVTLDDAELGRYVDEIFEGKQTKENVQKIFRDSALSYFPQFADRIKAGETVSSIVKPYRDMIASYLETDPESIGFGAEAGVKSDPLMNKALFGADGKAMSLFDLQKAIKQDNRWQKTANARDEYTNLTKSLLSSFGVGF